MDGWMAEGVLGWWSKFYVKFFESFSVKGACFFC